MYSYMVRVDVVCVLVVVFVFDHAGIYKPEALKLPTNNSMYANVQKILSTED